MKSVSTVLSKKHILGDTFKISMTEGQNQKCEEGKLRLVLSLTEPNGKGGDFNGNNVKDINHDEMKLAHLEGILPEQDQKSGEEAAENDGAPEQLSLEMNKWIAINLLMKIRSFSAFASLNLNM